MKVLNCLFLVLLVLGLLVPRAWALSVEEAYKSIQHRQTTFDAQISVLPAEEARYLAELFTLTDEAMRIKIDFSSHLYYEKPFHIGDYTLAYRSLFMKLDTLRPPKKLQKIHSLIYDAITKQQQFLNDWAKEANTRNYRTQYEYWTESAVLKIHERLFSAYRNLMRACPDERQTNLDAFYDHLSALDFL